MNNIIGVGIGGIIVYLILRIIHALLHEYKAVYFLNSSNIAVAVILADVYVVFDVLCIKAISTADVYTSCIVMVIATTLSITSAMLYQRKNLKEYIFKFEISTKYNDIRFALKDKFIELNIPYQYSTYWFQNDKNSEQEKSEGITYNEFGESLYHKYGIYCFSKRHSKQLENILNTYDKSVLKYSKINTSNYKE